MDGPGAEQQAPPSGVDRDEGPDAMSLARPVVVTIDEKNVASSRATLNRDEIPRVGIAALRAAQSESRIESEVLPVGPSSETPLGVVTLNFWGVRPGRRRISPGQVLPRERRYYSQLISSDYVRALDFSSTPQGSGPATSNAPAAFCISAAPADDSANL